MHVPCGLRTDIVQFAGARGLFGFSSRIRFDDRTALLNRSEPSRPHFPLLVESKTMARPCTVAMLLAAMSSMAAAQQSESFDRWEDSIKAFEAKIESGESKPGAILFSGSSSIRLWDLKQSFPDRNTINQGFGGSEIADSIHFFDRIVVPLRPRMILLYAGDNDIAKGKSAEQVHKDFQKFAQRVTADLPDTKLLFIAIKPSIKRWSMREQMSQANALIAEHCSGDDRLQFIDVWTPMLGPDGMPKPELFRDDGLHLNDDGYVLWTSVVKPQL